MKRCSIQFPEILSIFAFLLYLLGSSLTLITHGVELSLWLMTFAVVTHISTTVLPWLGFHWLALEKKGSKTGSWLAIFIYFCTWGCFGYGMLLRLWRNMPRFYLMITITTLLWAFGLIIFIYSQQVCHDRKIDDKLKENQKEK